MALRPTLSCAGTGVPFAPRGDGSWLYVGEEGECDCWGAVLVFIQVKVRHNVHLSGAVTLDTVLSHVPRSPMAGWLQAAHTWAGHTAAVPRTSRSWGRDNAAAAVGVDSTPLALPSRLREEGDQGCFEGGCEGELLRAKLRLELALTRSARLTASDGVQVRKNY